MAQQLRWEQQGRDWPHRECSSFIEAGGLRWHAQRFPSPGAPVALLLHGTGASTHSWRDFAPALQRHGFDVLAPDLPGHAFTPLPRQVTRSPHLALAGMAAGVHALLQVLDVQPALLVGHSAGAAVAARLVLDGRCSPRLVASLNGALLPLRGLPGRVFSPVARLLAATPLVPDLFAWRAGDPAVLERLLADTGSRLDERGRALYGLLVSTPSHAAAALGMMAQWDLDGLARDLGRMPVPVVTMAGESDRTVPPRDAWQVQLRLPPPARRPVLQWPRLGHLAHEEAPDLVAGSVADAWREVSAPAHP